MTQQRPPKKHHYLIFRHCVRAAKANTVALNDNDLDEEDPLKYMASIPQWHSTLGSCLPLGDEITKATGKWLVQGGLIPVGETAQWEILSDDMARDYDTAYYMATGIQTALEAQNKTEKAAVGLKTIHVSTEYFAYDDDVLDANEAAEELNLKQMQDNLEKLERPTLDFVTAINLMQSLAGKGSMGNLTSSPMLSKLLQIHARDEIITGAPALLDFFARGLFYSRAGHADPNFCPHATVRQVYQFVQFIHWNKVAIWANTNWAARQGAFQAHIMIQVLKHGSYLPSAAVTSCQSLVHEKIMNGHAGGGDDSFGSGNDFDTKVTILLGHNADLHVLATALNVHWELREPYISGTGGAFLPNSPLTGIHAVHDLEEGRIDLSVIYPMIVDMSDPDFDLDRSYFPVNVSGIMERTPLLFQRPVPFASTNEASANILAPPSERRRGWSSVDILENHVLQVLHNYGEQSFYREVSADYQAEIKAIGAAFETNFATSTLASPGYALYGILVMLAVAVLLYIRRFGRGPICRARKIPSCSGVRPSVTDSKDHGDEEMISLTL